MADEGWRDEPAAVAVTVAPAAPLPWRRQVRLAGPGEDVDRALGRLQRARVACERADRDRAAAVLAARALGVPWSVMGQALGVTGEAVRKRWG